MWSKFAFTSLPRTALNNCFSTDFSRNFQSLSFFDEESLHSPASAPVACHSVETSKRLHCARCVFAFVPHQFSSTCLSLHCARCTCDPSIFGQLLPISVGQIKIEADSLGQSFYIAAKCNYASFVQAEKPPSNWNIWNDFDCATANLLYSMMSIRRFVCCRSMHFDVIYISFMFNKRWLCGVASLYELWNQNRLLMQHILHYKSN